MKWKAIRWCHCPKETGMWFIMQSINMNKMMSFQRLFSQLFFMKVTTFFISLFHVVVLLYQYITIWPLFH